MRLLLAAALFMGLPVTDTLADRPLIDTLEGPDFAPEAGLFYKDNEEQRAGTYEFQSDVVRSGKGALKLSVKSQCSTAKKRTCSERAEIWQLTKLRVPYDQGVWNGFAVKFADPIPQDNHRYLIAQWKRTIVPGAPGDYSPFLALRLKHGKLFATVEANLLPGEPRNSKKCSQGLTPVWLRPDTNQTRALVATSVDWLDKDADQFTACTGKIQVINRGNPLPSPEEGWIDFAIYTKPGPNGDGHIELFANNKWIVTVKGHIGHNGIGLGPTQYFKFGPYRAAHSTEWTLYYDDYRRSQNCADVLRSAACPF
jgi:hypothetical protein